jgi:hypothetical protein
MRRSPSRAHAMTTVTPMATAEEVQFQRTSHAISPQSTGRLIVWRGTAAPANDVVRADALIALVEDLGRLAAELYLDGKIATSDHGEEDEKTPCE